MKRKIVYTLTTVALVISAFFIGKNTTANTPTETSTCKNVAIYEDGMLIDEDGEEFLIDWDVPDGSTLLVTYDTNGTFPRYDDIPLSYIILD